MSDDARIDRLDVLVDAILAGRPRPEAAADGGLASLADVAEELRTIPRDAFLERLGNELVGAARALSMEGRTPMTTAVATTRLTPYLIVRGAARAIDFYVRAFGAVEKMRLAEPGGRIGHALLEIGESALMLADEYPEHGIVGPQSLGGASATMSLAVEDVDAVFSRAVAAGARVLMPVQDEFYGERAGKLADPFGHVWSVSTTKEEVPAAEMQRRFDTILAGGKPAEGPGSPAPAGPRAVFHSVTPYLLVRRADDLIEFVKEAFGAVETMRATGSAGGRHAEVQIGDSMVMIGGVDEPSFQEVPAAIYLNVPDVDATHDRAVRAGATSTQAPADQPYGARVAFLKDPFGNTWYLATPLGT